MTEKSVFINEHASKRWDFAPDDLFLFYFLKITLSRSGRWYPIYAMLQACQQQIKLYLDARWNW